MEFVYSYPYRRKPKEPEKRIPIECAGCKYFPYDISRSSVYPCSRCRRFNPIDYYDSKD